MATQDHFPASRMDALVDGVFGVAMTLLVLEIKLPDPMPTDAAGLLAALVGLRESFGTYALAFFLLGLRWVMGLRPAGLPEATVSRNQALLTLLYLFFVTAVPFSTATLRHAPGLWPATSLFGLNIALMAAAGLVLTHRHGDARRLRGLWLLLGCAGVTTLLAPWLGGQALWSFALLAFDPVVARIPQRRTHNTTRHR